MKWPSVFGSWFRGRKSHDEASIVCEELEALLDLCCYSAAKAVACSKLIGRELNDLNTFGEDRENLLREQSELEIHLEELRETIEGLHALLHSARRRIERSQTDWPSASRGLSEILTGRDVEELNEAVRNLGKKSIGSEP